MCRRFLRAGSAERTGRLLVTGTFYNHGWFLSHAAPLSRCGASEVIFVADEPQCAPGGVRFVCPPRAARSVLGRAGAKLVWMLAVGIRERPDACMGFHLFPGAITALIVARLIARPAIYQMTGGPIEVFGGGCESENRLTGRLGRPWPSLERLAMRVVREFDAVVVRGRRAKRFLTDHGVNGAATIITGSVAGADSLAPLAGGCPQPSPFASPTAEAMGQPSVVLPGDVAMGQPSAALPGSEAMGQPCTEPSVNGRPIDLIFVGRLTAIKQPEQFVEIVARVAKRRANVSAVVVGDGPMLEDLRTQARQSGVGDCIRFLGQRRDVAELLDAAKLFVLTSRSEGLSIALAEAMGRGVPGVVADVGELGDLVASGVNGFLIEPGNIAAYAERALELLDDPVRWASFSARAREAAQELAGVENVAARWKDCLTRLASTRAAIHANA
jgi:glycosyltransferase involved in cell wall biosynthesis